MKFASKLSKKEIEENIAEYEKYWTTPKGKKDKETFEEMHKVLLKNGCLNNEQLYRVALWKTIRVSKIVKGKNPDEIVKDITRFALKMNDEKYKIRILCALDGIGIPRASTILTMSNPEMYGIIDVYAWFALFGKNKTGFSVDEWELYLKQVREMAKKHGKTPRQIDMALMKYGQKLTKL
jgi:hypothetical protein